MQDERTKKLIDTYKTQGNLTTGQIGDVFATTPANQPITSASLSNSETPLTIPQINQSSASSGLSAISSSVVPQTREATKIEQETQKKAEEEKGFLSRQKEKIQGLMQSVIGVQGSQANLETEAKIGEKTQKVTDVTNQIEALDRAELNEIRALGSQPGTIEQKAQRQSDIQRNYAFQKADLALIQSAANRDLLTAQSIVDRKIQLQLEPLKQQLEFETMFYDENRDAFTKAEDRAFQAKISADERNYDEAKTLQETIGKLQIQAASQGADPSIIQAIGRSKSMSEAIGNAGQYAGDIQDRQYKQAQINSLLANTEKTIAETAANSPANIAAKAQNETLNTLSLVDSLLESPYLGQVTGLKNPFTYWTPGSNEQYTKNQLNQVISVLSLENRQKLKGSGAISDFESMTLQKASSALGKNLSDEAAKTELKKVRGVMATASGLPATVEIKDPRTGQSQIVQATRDGINQAIIDGLLVEYK